jgi:hypothetical protein
MYVKSLKLVVERPLGLKDAYSSDHDWQKNLNYLGLDWTEPRQICRV